MLIFMTVFSLQNIAAQKAEGVKGISIDSLKKHNISVAKDSIKVYTVDSKNVYSQNMSVWEKCRFFARLLYDKYTILSWLLMILVVSWLLNSLFKLLGWLKDKL